jgi:hypothetical protein
MAFISFVLMAGLAFPGTVYAELLIDDFSKGSNLLGGRKAPYQRAPSRAMALQVDREHYGPTGSAVMIKYDKRGTGGPYGTGGWCGYYTLLKQGNTYFDASEYRNITFYVRGANGGENFKVGLADKHWDNVGDSVKSEEINRYLPRDEVTTEWQKATVPFDAFFLDFKELASIAICFESDCYPGGRGKGTIYIDDLKFE